MRVSGGAGSDVMERREDAKKEEKGKKEHRTGEQVQVRTKIQSAAPNSLGS